MFEVKPPSAPHFAACLEHIDFLYIFRTPNSTLHLLCPVLGVS